MIYKSPLQKVLSPFSAFDRGEFRLLHFKEFLMNKKLLGLVSVLASVGAFASSTTYSVPAPDYTNFFAGVGVMLGVSLTVMLARKLKSFIR